MYIKLEAVTKVTRVFHDGSDWWVDTESGSEYRLTGIVDQQFCRENTCYVLEFPSGSYLVADEKETNELLA